MKKERKKNFITVKTLKKDVRQYMKLKKAEKNAKIWYESFAVKNLLGNLEITLDYVYQMNQQEFDTTILYAMELIHKFQSEELARGFIWKYNELCKGDFSVEKRYGDIIFSIYQYVKNAPNYNRVDFTKEMKEMMRDWKGKTLQSYIENADDGYITVVRLCIDNEVFDIDNAYMSYWHNRENIDELTCFSCTETTINQPLLPSIVGGKEKENIINERIENIFIVKEIETNSNSNGEDFEFSYEVAFILQTKTRFYTFWRHLIFNTLEISICKDIKEAVGSIKELNEDDEEIEGVVIKKKKIVEQL